MPILVRAGDIPQLARERPLCGCPQSRQSRAVIFDKFWQSTVRLRLHLSEESVEVFLYQLIQHARLRTAALVVNLVLGQIVAKTGLR